VPEVKYYFTLLEVDPVQGIYQPVTPNLLPFQAFQFPGKLICNQHKLSTGVFNVH
jgi:hypothetical protein